MQVRFYPTVAANSSETDQRSPAAGEKWVIEKIGASAAYSKDTKIEIFVKMNAAASEIRVLATHGDTETPFCAACEIESTGYVKIVASNDSDQTETIGGWYQYLPYKVA